MGSSWNFPALASSSYEGSKPSRAELGHINFRAETELTITTICMSKIAILCLYYHYDMLYVQFYEFV